MQPIIGLPMRQIRPVAALAAIFTLTLLLGTLAEAAKARPAWIIPETCLLRSGPHTSSKKIGTLTRGTKVYVTSFGDKWCWCKAPGGQAGWIAEWLLQFSPDRGRELAQKSGGSAAATPKGNPPAWVIVSAANVRSGPGLGGESYGTLNQGDKVYVLARQGDWVKCKTEGGSGWIRGDLLTYDVAAGRRLAGTTAPPPAVTAAPVSTGGTLKAYVTGEKIFLRAGPGSRFDKRAALVHGQTVYVTARQGMWRKVTVHGGKSGWIADWLLKYDKPTPAAPQVATTAGAPGSASRLEHALRAWVTADTAQVRTRPTTEGPVKFKLNQGTRVNVAAVSGHWCKIRTASGDFGWIAGWLVKFVPPGQHITAKEAGERVEVNVGWVARPTVNLRSGPSTGAESVANASLGTRLIIIGKRADWYKVALEDGSIGWMSAQLIDTRAERQRRRMVAQSNSKGGLARADVHSPGGDFPSPTSGDEGESGSGPGGGLAATAKRFLGCAYTSGGTTPDGFDCSGFVAYVHRRHGIDLSHDSREMFRQGTPIARDELQPGDVVFFERTYRPGISHVGLYVGSGKFIHASNHRGGVKITALDSEYYGERYVGARRMY
jgi:cell wall-associated NlpC family hydrolase